MTVKYNDPRKLVARLKARKVRAEVPEELQARAHLIASKTVEVSSASEIKVSCDATFSTRILRSGLFDIESEGVSEDVL